MADHSHIHTHDGVTNTHEHSHDDGHHGCSTGISPTRAASTRMNTPTKERPTLILMGTTSTTNTVTRSNSPRKRVPH